MSSLPLQFLLLTIAGWMTRDQQRVTEYLLAEMLDRQPLDVQYLLLRTSLLDRVNGELADLLTGRPGSEQILLSLEDANAFVESLDSERTWFRYHHLFADFLRLELRRTLPAEVPLTYVAADGSPQHGQLVGPSATCATADAACCWWSVQPDPRRRPCRRRCRPSCRADPPSWPWCSDGDLLRGARTRRSPTGGLGETPGRRRQSPAPSGSDRRRCSCRWPGGAVTWPRHRAGPILASVTAVRR
jgi:hypothetical protein